MTDVSSSVEVALSENIRLIIWDLDDTFWTGTITEGGITYDDGHHALVVELAERGIMSSICSKNDFATVKAIMEEKDLWSYFIFPSIDWTPKASRLSSMIDAIGLRPASVLFIDDNPQNLAQAKHEVPSLNVATPDFIREIATHPRFKGKPDPDLSRLLQYQKLSEKAEAQRGFEGSNFDFLRKSNIRVYVEYDVEAHLDRAIELINRTNQLNFTKTRLPEDRAAAVAELVPFLRHPGTKAGLIRVVDDFGDYGFVGFYALTTDNREDYLRHFCFSCRTINMGVEQYIYAMLRRPHLTVVGEVISDLKRDAEAPDWIRALPISDLGAGGGPSSAYPISRMFARGGCDLMTLMHYFSLNCSDITTEFNGIKNWQLLRSDHSSFLVNALRHPGPDELAAAARLGYDEADFQTLFPWHDRSVPVVLLSFWADADIPRYRHKATGLEVPYFLNGGGMGDLISDTALAERLADRPEHHERVAVLREEWEYAGGLSLPEMVERYKELVHAVAAENLVVLLTANERRPEFFTQAGIERDPQHAQYNVAIRSIAAADPRVILVDVEDFIASEADLLDINHFRREIYFDIYCFIVGEVRARQGGGHVEATSRGGDAQVAPMVEAPPEPAETEPYASAAAERDDARSTGADPDRPHDPSPDPAMALALDRAPARPFPTAPGSSLSPGALAAAAAAAALADVRRPGAATGLPRAALLTGVPGVSVPAPAAKADAQSPPSAARPAAALDGSPAAPEPIGTGPAPSERASPDAAITASTSSSHHSTRASEPSPDLLAERVARTLSRLLPPRWRP